MPIEIKVPSVGESITSGVLGVWNKPDGAYVKAGDPIFEIETDKVTSEIVAESSGKLKHLVKVGDTVQIGQVVASIDEKAAAPKEAAPPLGTAAATSEAAPAAKKEAGNGSKEKLSRVEASVPVAAGAARGKNADDLSPAVRYQAEEKGINPALIAGTGKDGRVLKGDVLSASEKPVPSVSSVPLVPSVPKGDRTSRRKMSPLRQKIAARLLAAQQETAHLTTFNEVDLSNVMALRTKFQDRFVKKHEIKLGFMSFFVKASIEALKKYPAVNASVDGTDIIYHEYYDIGVAVSTDRGLIVPVVRDADSKSFAGIEKEVADYARKAREGSLTIAELTGGTFTITNGGVFGSLMSTPIVNAPQSAILGMHKIQERPMVVNGAVVARPMMYLAVTYDHRIIDGREAVQFLVAIKESLEDPGRMLLGI